VKLKRYEGNPILSPNPANNWEDLAVFNPGACYDEERKEVVLLYRAAEAHPEYKCYFGLAKSKDGYHFERLGFVSLHTYPDCPAIQWLSASAPAPCQHQPAKTDQRKRQRLRNANSPDVYVVHRSDIGNKAVANRLAVRIGPHDIHGRQLLPTGYIINNLDILAN
jgi:hypothetical protein